MPQDIDDDDAVRDIWQAVGLVRALSRSKNQPGSGTTVAGAVRSLRPGQGKPAGPACRHMPCSGRSRGLRVGA